MTKLFNIRWLLGTNQVISNINYKHHTEDTSAKQLPEDIRKVLLISALLIPE